VLGPHCATAAGQPDSTPRWQVLSQKQAVHANLMLLKIKDFSPRLQALDQQCDGFASPLDIQQDKP
jgi:hypothetical protein